MEYIYNFLNIGGINATLGEFPHQALIGYKDGTLWACGGSLVSPNFVLTAAHCSAPHEYGPASHVTLGSNSRTDSDAFTVVVEVAKLIDHPNYSATTMQNDISLIKLQQKVLLNQRVLPICLPSKQYTSNNAIVTGFGLTGFDEKASVNLLKVTLERFTHQECSEVYEKMVKLNETVQICYGHHTERKDSCNVNENTIFF
jgi:trypsin